MLRGVGFDITYRCNQECVFCYNPVQGKGRNRAPELGTAEIKKAWLKICSSDIPKYVVVSGGEPLLREDLVDLVSCFAETGSSVILITNGTLVTESRAAELAAAGISKAQVTLLGGDPGIHDRLAGTGSFNRAVHGIMALLETGITVTTNFVATGMNIAGFAEAVQLNIIFGIREIGFCLVHPGYGSSKSKHGLIPSREEVQTALRQGNRILRGTEANIYLETPVPACLIDMTQLGNVVNRVCRILADPLGYVHMDPGGGMRLCPLHPAVMGDITRHDIRERLRGYLDTQYHIRPAKECIQCDDWQYCRGACPVLVDTAGRHGIHAYETFWNENAGFSRRKINRYEV